METKLKRSKIIKKYVGEGLADLGFSYGEYEENTWIFQRNLGKLTWYVYIYVYRFDPWQITFHLGTNVPGKMQVQAHQVEGIKSNGELPGYWKYHDEDSMIEVLEEMLDIIRNQGIGVLKKLSVLEKVNVNDREMHHNLYLYHKELAEAFIQRTGMVSTGYDEENLKRWFDYIDLRIEELSKGKYDDNVKKELLEMAAFLGEQIVKYRGGRWNYSENKNTESFCIVCSYHYSKFDKNATAEMLINILRLLGGKYLGNNRWWMEEDFYEIIK
ncbi:MAG: hypothetical protein ACI4AA_00710 [Lachnospiraceae bacterium]